MLTHTFFAGVALVGATWAVAGRAVGIGALAGALFALANVAAFRFVVARILAAHRAGALMPLKMIGTLTVLYILQRILGLEPAGLAIGYGALVVGLLSAALRQSSLSLRTTEI